MHAIVDDLFYDRTRAPRALVLGNDPARRDRLAGLIAARGGLVVTATIAGADESLDARAVSPVVAIDATDEDATLGALLERVAASAVTGRFEALVLLSVTALDLAVPLLGLDGVTLVDARDLDRGELTLTIDALLAPPAAGVAEEGDEDRRRRLAALGEDAARIARALAAMAAVPDGAEAVAAPADPVAELAFLRSHIRLRRLRGRCFDAALFADPAWDILLDLRLAALEGRRVAVSSLCIAAAVPTTTGLRWIGAMTARGLLARAADPEDGRRAFVTLSPAAETAMARFAGLATAGSVAA